MASPLAIVVLIIAAPLIVIAMAFKRLRGVADEPTPIAQYVLIPPADLGP
jgi:type IV secretory pathway VirB6-like protein